MSQKFIVGTHEPMGKSTYQRYWHKPGNKDVHRDIPRGEVLSMINAATKRAASKAPMRTNYKDRDSGTTKATETSGSLQPWQFELFRTFRSAPRAYYSWAEVHALRNVAAMEAADKARRRSILSSDNINYEKQFKQDDKNTIRYRRKSLRTLLRFLARIDSNLESSHSNDGTLENLLIQRDLYMVTLRTSWIADQFSVQYRIVRPLACIEDDTMDKTLRSDKITGAIRTAIQQGRRENKIRDKLAREDKIRQRKMNNIRSYHPTWDQLPLRSLNLRQPRVSPEVYRKFKNTTRVQIAGEWHIAVIDQSQNSVIDSQIAWGADISKPVRCSVMPALFQNFPEEPRAKIRMTLETTEGYLEITPTLTPKDRPHTDIILGKDLFLQEQVVPRGVLCYLDEHKGELLDTMRLLDGTSNVKVRILLPEKPLDDDEPLYHDQKLVWWDYWESRS